MIKGTVVYMIIRSYLDEYSNWENWNTQQIFAREEKAKEYCDKHYRNGIRFRYVQIEVQ
ncbi:hypothetical protein [Vallitalea guaymasensis]|uniref:hypothetical protein n=1 Tax=Vallitalea guaymasensis TaxID=1185412 RepID=UPI00187D4D9F|nr:hypothetical protein [Vallitalea guaymasensis]